MARNDPVTELDPRYGDKGATATRWSEVRKQLEDAELFWVTTVRPDGRPHITPLLALWLDDALYFCTGPEEQKAKNIAANPVVRVKVHGRWRDGIAHPLPEDNARRRLLRLNPPNSLFLWIAGKDLLTVRINLQ